MTNQSQIGAIQIIKGQNGGNYPSCNSLFLEKDGIVIDPASDYDALLTLSRKHAVSAVWLSHWHEDHFIFLDFFAESPLFIAQKNAPTLSSLDTLREITGFLPMDDKIHLACDTVSIINAAGHTPGHIALYFHDHQVLFLGDGDRDSRIEQILASLEKLRAIPAKTLITSHGMGTLSADESGDLWERYTAVILEREKRIMDSLTTPQSFNELASRWLIYKKPREPKAFFEFGERALLKKRLELLIKKEIVFMTDSGKLQIR